MRRSEYNLSMMLNDLFMLLMLTPFNIVMQQDAEAAIRINQR